MGMAATIGPRVSGVARRVPTWPVYVLGMAPGAWLAWQAIVADVYIDPVQEIEHRLGKLTLQFLLASLTVTPLLRFARINLVKFRKPLGLLAFGYLVLHFLAWLTLDLALRWGMIGTDILKRPYLTIGFAAFLLLIPLAATSWQGAVRRMGTRGWKRLHMLVYPATLLATLHYVMQERVWTAELLAYLAIALLLVSARLLWLRSW